MNRKNAMQRTNICGTNRMHAKYSCAQTMADGKNDETRINAAAISNAFAGA